MKDLSEIKDILSKHKNYLKEKYGVIKVEIFGSFVRGEQKSISDVDIVVEFEKTVSLLKIVSLENYLSDIIGIKVDVVPKKNIRVELRDDILKEVIPV
ncbi:MAG: nucleotidyltransferase family protein [Candidatus Heimdallarchaeaceae archaeon]